MVVAYFRWGKKSLVLAYLCLHVISYCLAFLFLSVFLHLILSIDPYRPAISPIDLTDVTHCFREPTLILHLKAHYNSDTEVIANYF